MTGRTTIVDLLGAARRRIRRLTPAAAQRAMSEGALLIDTRDRADRVRTGSIPGSVHVPLSVLFWRLDPASESRDPALSDLARPIVLICAHGYSSSLAAATLLELGFDSAGDVIGGIEAWAAAGLPLEPTGVG